MYAQCFHSSISNNANSFCQEALIDTIAGSEWGGLHARGSPRFFDQVGHQTPNAFIGN